MSSPHLLPNVSSAHNVNNLLPNGSTNNPSNSDSQITIISVTPNQQTFKAILPLVLTSTLNSLIFGLVLAATNSCAGFLALKIYDVCGRDHRDHIINTHNNIHGEEREETIIILNNCGEQKTLEQVGVAMSLIGAGLGSLGGGNVSEKWGRRGAMLKVNAIGIPIFALTAISPNYLTFYLLRFLSGVVIGAVSVVVPLYIGEICTDSLRGTLGVFHQLFITIGIFISDALGLVQSQNVDFRENRISERELSSFDLNWWRFMVAFPAFASTLSVILWSFVFQANESPVWLVRNNRDVEAEIAISKIRPGLNSKEELRLMIEEQRGGGGNSNTLDTVSQGTSTTTASSGSGNHGQQANVPFIETNNQNQNSNTSSEQSFLWALKHPIYRKGVLIGIALSCLQQTTGINVVITQSSSMFANVAPFQYATLLTALSSLINIVCTLICVPLIEKWGRRFLLLFAASGTTFCMGIALLAILLSPNGSDTGLASVLVPLSLLVFIVFFAIGWGPVLWVYLSEIYPAQISGSCVALAIAFNWLACCFVVFGLGSLLSDPKICYSLLFLFNIVGLAFVSRYVVETKGTNAENSPLYYKESEGNGVEVREVTVGK